VLTISGNPYFVNASSSAATACSSASARWVAIHGRVASQMMRDKDKALDTLTREELGLDPAELGGNPWTAAGVSFCLFSLGAIFPAMPFVWAHGVSSVVQCVVASSIGLAAIGIFTSLFNGRSATFSAIRQVGIGLVAAAFTFGVGHVLGVSLS
jgi:VIT1/CCC1 family predicted Fe2+/Mn2+ transporter